MVVMVGRGAGGLEGGGGVSRLEEQALNHRYLYSSFRQHI